MLIWAQRFSACIASIIRLHILYDLSLCQDPTWDNPGVATWSAIELNIGVVCVCFSTLRPLLAIFMPRIFGTRQSNATPGYNYAGSRSKNSRIRDESQPSDNDSGGDSDQIYLRTDIAVTRSKSYHGNSKVYENNFNV